MTIRIGSHAERLATKGKQAIQEIRRQLLDGPTSYRLGKGLSDNGDSTIRRKPLKPLIRRID
jgi:hypothetical protein